MIQIILFFVLLLASNLMQAEVRYVSKTGNSTPPYTSPETASDSIKKCIDVSNPGDTIVIEKGMYLERLILTKKVHLFGAGADSTIIQFNSDHSVIHVRILSAGIIQGLSIINTSSAYSHSIYTSMLLDDTLIVRNCKFFSKSSNISHGSGHIVAYENYGKGGTFIFTLSDYTSSTISVYNNIGFMDWDISTFSTHATILNNLLYSKERIIYLQNNAPHLVANNICISENNTVGTGIKGLGVTFLNNLVSGYFEWGGIGLHLHGVIKNNIVINSHTGVTGAHPDGYPTDYVVKYNNFYRPINTYRNMLPDNTNIDVFPMFNSEQDGDFRLQKYSPLIDAGDPAILDLDGTRSDIGPYGGPYGMVYEYEDRPPLPPVMVSFNRTRTSVMLFWRKNHERDLTDYRIYADTTSAGFSMADSLLVGQTQDTTFSLPLPDSGRVYYYRISARDSIGNESALSNTLTLVMTSIEEQTERITPEQSGLAGNYPNPFNPTTTIVYRLAERSYVKLYIYTLKGELYDLRVNEEQQPGEYRYLFNPKEKGTMSDLASGAYFYMLETKGRETGKINRETGKMLLIK
ncbi:MAG: hypothetical protein L6Q47_02885 [Ignavibacteriaceae bacterium]|nr:hypothetical protein [Ignavibacteriaceae bacterium]